MAWFWSYAGSVLTVGVLGVAALGVVSAVAHEEVRDTTRIAAAGIQVLRVDNDEGDVEVLGGDVDEITVEADISHGLRRTETHIAAEGAALVVDADCPVGIQMWCRADYRITVPADLAVDVDGRNGRITLRDLDGPVVADGRNGGIELTRLAGTVRAQTRNGAVRGRGLTGDDVEARSANGRIELSFAGAPDTVTARTRNGPVDVVLPDGAEAYRVQVESFVGDTDTAVRTDPSSDRSIVALTRNGSVTIRYPTG